MKSNLIFIKIKLIVLFLLLITDLAEVNAQRVKEIIKQLQNPNGRVLVVAHRGDWRNAPENSIQAIHNAIAMGVDIVEIDIHKTKDGQLVLMHDETIDRTMVLVK
jgi:glycerophosphoryl diester phosphodiesterase